LPFGLRPPDLTAALPHTGPAKGRQNFVTITNEDATRRSVRQTHRNVAAGARHRRKNDTVDTLRNPDRSQLLGSGIPRPTKTAPSDICQLPWKRPRNIKISLRRHRENICHPGILSGVDLLSTAQSAFAGRDFTHGGLLFKARVDGSHTYRYKAAAIQPCPFATNYVVGMKYRNATDRKKSPLREVAPAINSASCLRAARPSLKPVLQPEGGEIRR